MLFDAKRELLVHIKLVLLLSTSMAGSTLMAGTLQHEQKQSKLSEFSMGNRATASIKKL